MDLQTPLAKVRGLGTTKTGTAHFWAQRITAVALIPLSFWMVSYTAQLLTASHTEITIWLAGPVDTTIAITWIVAVFYHAALGLQVVVEDYIHTQWLKITAIGLIKLIFCFLALAATVAIFKISLTP